MHPLLTAALGVIVTFVVVSIILQVFGRPK